MSARGQQRRKSSARSSDPCPDCPDCVAKRFCASECARLIQGQGSRRKVDSRIHSPRFDCCVFLFYSFSAVTFATESANCGPSASQQRTSLFDHLVGAREQLWRHVEAERLGCLEVDDQFV